MGCKKLWNKWYIINKTSTLLKTSFIMLSIAVAFLAQSVVTNLSISSKEIETLNWGFGT